MGEETPLTVPQGREGMGCDRKKDYGCNQDNVATALIFQSIPKTQILQVGGLSTAKEMWEALKTRHLGADRVRETRFQTLMTEFETLKMDTEKIDDYANKLTEISSKSGSLGQIIEETRLVKKFLTCLPRRFIQIVASLEQARFPLGFTIWERYLLFKKLFQNTQINFRRLFAEQVSKFMKKSGHHTQPHRGITVRVQVVSFIAETQTPLA
ncbi:hypothetical protein E3N88_04783 [Mikania micrantha]|uniref:Uncharacterized protein n=1 Tax=Mikania micrantha TaxID=192012 RepID=A0A5N6PVF3_9ASTR|nr:hypothetical protein E3N88_04783 [Mikania micrantha]